MREVIEKNLQPSDLRKAVIRSPNPSTTSICAAKFRETPRFIKSAMQMPVDVLMFANYTLLRLDLLDITSGGL